MCLGLSAVSETATISQDKLPPARGWQLAGPGAGGDREMDIH